MNMAGFNGEMLMSPVMHPEAVVRIQQVQRQLQIPDALLDLYQRQETFSVPNQRARTHLDAVVDNVIARPRFATVLSAVGEGGNGKSSMAAEWLAKFNLHEDVVQRIYDATGKFPISHFISSPTTGQNMMKEYGPDGLPLVKHTASEWDAEDRRVIMNRMHTSINIAHRMLPIIDPEHVHIVVAEYVFGFTGNAMANPVDHFAVYRMTNRKVQEVASKQRDTYKDRQSKPAKAYQKEGRSLDDPKITAEELREYMGSRESIGRGDRMGTAMMMDRKEELEEEGIKGITEKKLGSDRFRNRVLRQLFKMHMKEIGIKPGRGIILPNDYVEPEEGMDLDYHHRLVAAYQMNTTALVALR